VQHFRHHSENCEQHQQLVTVTATATDDLQCFMNKIDLTYTKPDGTAGSASDTIGAALTVTFKITAKAGTRTCGRILEK